ncbi:MAG: hypothetical protein HY791_12475 [Deltaproteobacteria bacterium]|nr:hypothetical protein [Deltaproteobacteria bacterium]
MKKSIRSTVLSLALTAPLAMTSMAVAAPEKEEVTAPERVEKKKEHSSKIEGTIVSIDAAARTVEIKTSAGYEQLRFSANAKIKKSGKDLPLTGLKAGDKVTVMTAMEEGSRVVSEVSL